MLSQPTEGTTTGKYLHYLTAASSTTSFWGYWAGQERADTQISLFSPYDLLSKKRSKRNVCFAVTGN